MVFWKEQQKIRSLIKKNSKLFNVTVDISDKLRSTVYFAHFTTMKPKSIGYKEGLILATFILV